MKRVFAHIGFAFAVTLIVLNLIPYTNACILILSAGLGIILISSLAIKKYRRALTVPVCVGAALIACLVFLCTYNATVLPQQSLDSETADTVFYIVDLEEIDDDGNYNYIVKTESVALNNAPQNIKLKVKSTVKINAEYYQKISAKLKFYSVGCDAFSSFGNWGNNVFLSAQAENVRVRSDDVHSPMKTILKLREKIIHRLYSLNPNQNGALSVALVTGYKGLFSERTSVMFKYAGTSHIVAVSGFHLTIVMAVILFVLKRLKINNKASAVVLILSVVFFSALAGFSKSVVRAGIMAVVMLLGEVFGRKSDALNSLGLAVFIICLNPFAVSDIGACLSVLAVLAIVTLYPVLLKRLNDVLHKNDLSADKSVRNVLNCTLHKSVASFLLGLSVMIYTLPIMYIYFSYVSLSGLVSNVLVTPLAGVAIPVSAVTFIFGKVPVVSGVLAAATDKVCHIILAIIRYFASLKNAVLVFNQSFGLILAFILIIFAICFILNKKKLLPYVSFFCALLLAGCAVANIAMNSRQSRLLVCENDAVVISSEKKTIVYGVNDENDYYSVCSYLQSYQSDIDYLIVDESSEYAMKLIKVFDTKNVIVPYFDEKLLKSMQDENYIAGKDFRMEYNENFAFAFCSKEKIRFRAFLNNVNACVSEQPVCFANGICVCGNSVTDDHGKIDLKDGDVLYSFDSDGVYSVRRLG